MDNSTQNIVEYPSNKFNNNHSGAYWNNGEYYYAIVNPKDENEYWFSFNCITDTDDTSLSGTTRAAVIRLGNSIITSAKIVSGKIPANSGLNVNPSASSISISWDPSKVYPANYNPVQIEFTFKINIGKTNYDLTKKIAIFFNNYNN